MRRCCNQGCDVLVETLKDIDRGYRVGFGFMLWACPKHAQSWAEFDIENWHHEQTLGEKFQEDYEKWETEWYENYTATNPEPIPPKYQPSMRK